MDDRDESGEGELRKSVLAAWHDHNENNNSDFQMYCFWQRVQSS